MELVENYFPAIAPALFPDTKLARWTSQPEYELQSISKLRQKIVEVQENARLEVNRLEESIQSEQEENNYLFDLARETGNSLVEAVKAALQVLGFLKVVDVDELLERDGLQRQNREDLQIHDSEPTLVVEIKGISHYPTDEDALTVQKYVVLRMKEWNRVNVKGMSIVNHQRHFPPLDRNNKMPFRQDVIDAATEQEIGLLTGWDLHRLVRSYVANGWKHADVEGLFFKSGRIAIVPAHYQEIGIIERFIERINVVGIRLANTLRRGDRIAFELPVMFKEQNCVSLQYENKTIDAASAGMLVGIVTELSKEEARVGVRVFRVLTAEI